MRIPQYMCRSPPPQVSLNLHYKNTKIMPQTPLPHPRQTRITVGPPCKNFLDPRVLISLERYRLQPVEWILNQISTYWIFLTNSISSSLFVFNCNESNKKDTFK